jgi:hypothetical protein
VVVKLSWSIASLTRGFSGLSSGAPCGDHPVTDRPDQAESGWKTLKVHDGIKFLNRAPEDVVALVSDAIRYTFQYRETHYTQGVWSDIGRLRDEGFKLDRLRNSWFDEQYKGINSQWIEPDTGQRFEVQFHTRISYEAKQLTHKAYERLRAKQADAFEELVLEAFQKKVAGEVPVPPGATDIPDYPERRADAR